MASGRLVLLSDDEIAHIYETSLKILQEIGIKILSKKVQSLLAESGAEVDSAHSIAKIPSSLVEEAAKKVSEEIVLRGRDPKFDLRLPAKDFPFVGLNGCSAFIRDFETGEKRRAKASDSKDFAILSDYLNGVDFFWPIVWAADMPTAVQTIRGLAVAFNNIRKHVQWQARAFVKQ